MKTRNKKYFCKICSSSSKKLFQVQILSRYLSTLSKCDKCNFCQFNNVTWLKNIYTNRMTDRDLGALRRNISLTFAIYKFINKYYFNDKILDYGGGYGIIVRMLNDLNIKAFWQDKYCENIFAADKTANTKDKYRCIFAFELLEHLEHPNIFIQALTNKYFPETILFSTQIVPENLDSTWWYLMPDIGQHVSFYSKKSLKYLAEKYGYRYYSFKFIHLFTKLKINQLQFGWLIINSLLTTPFKYLFLHDK